MEGVSYNGLRYQRQISKMGYVMIGSQNLSFSGLETTIAAVPKSKSLRLKGISSNRFGYRNMPVSHARSISAAMVFYACSQIRTFTGYICEY